jgi:RimJ/RimL family protein N-acetyltransferase
VIDYDAFFTYFFATASSTIIGIVHPASSEITSAPATIEEARGGRSWQECVGGCYYIKPNYPGRASHNCNAGFIVPPSGRGNGSGGGLAKSFLTYAPALGYRASVFNLVFESE